MTRPGHTGLLRRKLNIVTRYGRAVPCRWASWVYFNQPRRRKYHMGTTALAAMRAMAIG
jgi:hypothetical protein